MSEFLTVRLSSDKNAQIQWLVWSTTQSEIIASGELNGWEELGELSGYAEQRQGIVLLSSDDIVLAEVDTPAGSSRQLESMLPYLLEDEIAQDVDELHFTVLSKQAKKACIAAVDKRWLKACLDELQDAGINISKVLPDVLALPKSGELTAANIGQHWLVRKGDSLGLSLPSPWLETLTTSDWVKEGQEYLPLTSYSPLPTLELDSEQSWQSVDAPLIMQLLTEGALGSKVTLLTGEFKPNSSLLKYWSIWKKTAVAAAVIGAVFVGQYGLQISQDEAKAEAYRAESERIFREALPGKTRIPTVSYLKRQMNDEATRLSGGGGGSPILDWLNQIPDSLKANNSMTLLSIRYDGNRDEVRIQAKSKDFQSFEQVRIKFAEHFEVEQGQLSRSGESVNGSFVLKR
ncbi:type II secretion system protein GspL [Vibrio genomosp. F10 str. 9ZC157]|uniref:Type II secretion system protein L n=1 Tax=Vibrio genomosp. F10 str. ZF-129 TaxID=1187848 RepID=A0A1E5BD41_9VIBR|nr:type II secretion system protein GspL [Vibrio genomosp. F10]OEE33058.1 type II secretion system protein GspL [Vibrio genomosp. F10 str. ZF-129]OEE98197.1 type II secretion system protein GspL [Vibrio genomosp. F10 str. 9ZC157]OEF04625.1 type II secretion system protein GspL [Vibrio genomosp. F10 str. 9ZD137]